MRPAQTLHFTKVKDWDWIRHHIGFFWSLSSTHLYLSLLAVAIGLVVSVPLGVLAVRVRSTYPAILAVTTLLYSVPALAAFAFLVSIIGPTNTTVIIPLATYSLAILVRSVADGLDGVPEEVLLSADAMGYRPFRRLLSVELPAALPVMIGGLRVAAVSSISLATVGALVGISGLGKLFIDGENANFLTEIWAGVVLIAGWALVFDALFLVGGRLLTPWSRR